MDGAVPSAVTVEVTNTGVLEGAEVVQLYVAPTGDQGTYMAKQELAGYAKVSLTPGETKTVRIEIAEHAFSVFDPKTDGWLRLGGEYELRVGASSRDIRQVVTVNVDGDVRADEYPGPSPSVLPHYFRGEVADVPDAEFEALLGTVPPSAEWSREEPLTANSIIAELPGHSALGTAVHGTIVGAAKLLDAIGKPIPANYARFLLAFPLRALTRMTQGAISEDGLETIIQFLNGQGITWLREKK